MLDKLLSFIAPHLCSGCGKAGDMLCVYCKEDIINEPFQRCLSCRRLTARPGVCADCKLPYQESWCVGERRGTLQNLIGQYKFSNARAAYQPLGELLNQILPVLPASTVIVPIPTAPAHIRQRGYDHMYLIARYLAKQRDFKLQRYLSRTRSSTQRGASRNQRIAQAKDMFVCFEQLDPSLTYMVVDDVVTTGATIKYAARALRRAGARSIIIAVIARQPLD